MRDSSPLTYAGALQIIHGRQHRILRVLDRLADAGLLLGAVVFPPVLALVDAKQELTGVLRDGLGRATERLGSAGGRDRLELIAAAHTTVALSAIFDAIAQRVGPSFARLEVTEDEKLQLASAPGHLVKQQEWTAALLAADIPMPGPTRGFQENLDEELAPRFTALANKAVAFFEGLRAWRELDVDAGALRAEVSDLAVSLYRERYTRMAAEVPEFFVWASIGEHAATRDRLTTLNEAMAEILAGQSEAMGKLHDLLASANTRGRPEVDLYRSRLARVNAAALHKPLLRTGSVPSGLSLPTVTQGFVTPRFRTALSGPGANASQEAWWADQPVHDGLDEFLAAFLAHPQSVRAPLVVLGHPGAGKSMLTSVLAARLPSESFTVVPVQLRRVNADDSVHAQIETALQDLLHEQVSWARIADEGHDAVRVVLLDGFDELMQATGAAQSSYLSEVKAFQEHEYDLGRPVAVVVTSRTLVVDRARIPPGCLLVKLEDFDDAQLGSWLSAWNAANAASEGFRPLTVDEVLHHGTLARQPLLLTMLAIYAADPDADRLDAGDLSTAALYQRLLESFIRRQVIEKPERPPAPEEVPTLMATERWALSIAAYAMFNRGRQYATEGDLDRDLEALLGQSEPHRQRGFGARLGRARQTMGNFFFVHVSHADEGGGPGRQSYEFLHATFGEFLLADRAIRLLEGYARQHAIHRGDPSAHPKPDDSMLRALLSHQPLVERRPALEFARQLLLARDETFQQQIVESARYLVAGARSGYVPSDYRPTVFDVVDRAALYTINLVLLAAAAGGFPLAEPHVRGLARLWWAVVPAESWDRLDETLTVEPNAGALELRLHNGDARRGRSRSLSSALDKA
ncbi:hypothetical protein Ais01nite_69190 [Asanoa ishikariensis]|uniref:NACHT N-terminal Helical domain-containing protein n=1 Tax=Asanoa ishikariensis TaxID=137265 RepID=A0A1H3N477_9ACTN|nr:hypothetical protein [Asanoa ishikariensis]GIF68884.1 hypothetical protein Ais01nite_69190 [Asanoa ishikariensis]SDY83265.1 hypothetical protein SAMN05421684_1786 [Asanoa ishikariensis]